MNKDMLATQFRSKSLRKKLTLRKFLLSPLVILLAVLMVAAYGWMFDPAMAQDGSAGGFANWVRHNMAPIMFVSMVLFLLLGYPTAFTLAGVGMVFGIIGIELGEFSANFFGNMNTRLFGVMNNETLLAIPFFTFMGLILERSGMAEDLLDTIGQLFGSVRGGLAYAVIFVGALLAATTGVVAASVIAMGLISLPIMMRYGYDRKLASGVIAASGTLAQIIPPSLVLIIMADQLGVSVGPMYIAAFLPGLLLAGFYALWILIQTIIRPKSAPGIPADAISYRKADGKRGLTSFFVLVIVAMGAAWWLTTTFGPACLAFVRREAPQPLRTDEFVVVLLFFWILIVFFAAVVNDICAKFFNFHFLSPIARAASFVLMPPLFLIFLVLGTIIIGLATPTEGGAMGALGAMLLAWSKRVLSRDPSRFNYNVVNDALVRTGKLSAFVLFILIGARLFSLTFYGVSGHLWVKDILTSVTGSEITFLILISVLVFFLAFFLDFFELAFIAVPLIAPAATALGIDLVWLGIILSVNMQTSFMHPPFGFALIFLRSVAPNKPYIDKITGQEVAPVTTGQIYWGAVPYVVIQLIMVVMIIFIPALVMYYKGSEVQLDDAAVNEQLENINNDLQLQLDAPSFK